MSQYSIEKIKPILTDFCESFDHYRQEIIADAKELGVKLKLFSCLTGKSLHFVCLMSKVNGEIFIEFKKSNKFGIEFHEVPILVMSYYTPGFETTPPRFTLPSGSKYINVGGLDTSNSFHFTDCYPHFPKNQFVKIYNLTFHNKKRKTSYLVEFGLFDSNVENFENLNKDTVKTILYNLHRDFKESEPSLDKLTSILKRLIENESTTEKQIDDFLVKNPLILEVVLNIDNSLSQILLKDVNQEIGQHLKPDLIGYDILDKQWKIIDFKRANRDIIKSKKTVRVAFTAEITSLQAQLQTYREYFNDFNCRKDFKDKNGHEIKYPTCIGIVGKVDEDDRDEFNKIKNELPAWFKVFAYNDIVDYLEQIIAKKKKQEGQ